jgi:hypothetical protein
MFVSLVLVALLAACGSSAGPSSVVAPAAVADANVPAGFRNDEGKLACPVMGDVVASPEASAGHLDHGGVPARDEALQRRLALRPRRLRRADVLPRLPVVGEGRLGGSRQGRRRRLLVGLVAMPRRGDLVDAGLLGARYRRDELALVGLERLLRDLLGTLVDGVVARLNFRRDRGLLGLVRRAARAALAATERKMPPRNRRGSVAAHEVLEGGPVVPYLAFREHQCSALLVTPVSAPISQ